MWSPRRFVLYLKAVCALAGLFALVGLQALLGLNGRPPVIIVRWQEADTLAESEPSPTDPPAKAA
jgi:hypothetical protein